MKISRHLFLAAVGPAAECAAAFQKLTTTTSAELMSLAVERKRAHHGREEDVKGV
jgi:hypothetical protein